MNLRLLVTALAALTTLTSCGITGLYDGQRASARLQSRSGSHVTGWVIFTQVGDRVRVTGDLAGHTPGPKGFHIHEKGDCTAPDAMSAGGHFNPDKKQHGLDSETGPHAGDMANFTVAGKKTDIHDLDRQAKYKATKPEGQVAQLFDELRDREAGAVAEGGREGRVQGPAVVIDEGAADDLVQETLLRALANINSFQPGTNMSAWLFTILRNHFRSEYRKRRRGNANAAECERQRWNFRNGNLGEIERAAPNHRKHDQEQPIHRSHGKGWLDRHSRLQPKNGVSAAKLLNPREFCHPLSASIRPYEARARRINGLLTVRIR